MIDLYHINYINDNKKEENLKNLLDNCIDEEFIEIKLHLLRILGKNIECLDTYLNNGWELSFRIHNASTLVEPSLKFDIQFIGMPLSILNIECRWY